MIYGLWRSDEDDDDDDGDDDVDDDDGYGACDAYLLPPVSPNCSEGAPSEGGQESRGGAGKEMENGKCKMYSCTCRTCPYERRWRMVPHVHVRGEEQLSQGGEGRAGHASLINIHRPYYFFTGSPANNTTPPPRWPGLYYKQ